VPVMYAGCGGSLFTQFGENAKKNGYYRNDITIHAATMVNPKLKDKIQSFRVFKATTDCKGDGWTSLPGLSGTYSAGEDSGVRTTSFDRTVTVRGQKKTIGCSINMSVRVNLQDELTYGGGSGG
ncbi:MAG: hypothetical protein ABEI07_01530, partial [Candidatus Nanohaloarchaea archaeon]